MLGGRLPIRILLDWNLTVACLESPGKFSVHGNGARWAEIHLEPQNGPGCGLARPVCSASRGRGRLAAGLCSRDIQDGSEWPWYATQCAGLRGSCDEHCRGALAIAAKSGSGDALVRIRIWPFYCYVRSVSQFRAIAGSAL